MQSPKRRKTPKRHSLMIWDVPADLKRKFKTACAERGISMKEVVLKMLHHYVTNGK